MQVDLITHRYPPDLGGIERHVRELAHNLTSRGHDVSVHATRWRRNQPRLRIDEGIPVKRHFAIAPGEAYYAAPSMTAAAYRSDADVIHAHGYHSLPLVFAALGAGNTPFVATPHYTGRGSTTIRGLLHRVYAPLGGRALRSADEVIAVSEWERTKLREDFDCASTVVPNGIEIDRFRRADPYGHDRPYLFSIGRLVEYKGVQHVIRALSKLPDYDLLVAGTGEYRKELERVARETGVDDRVEFLGFVDDDDVPGLYAGAAAHVFLSAYECFGLTVGESLAAGTPCVVSDATALSEWDNHVGCVSTTDMNPGSVASAIRRAVGTSSDPSGLLSWKEMAAEIEAVYERVVETRATTSSRSSR